MTIQSILSARHLGRKLQFKPKGKNKDFEEVIGKTLKDMEIILDKKVILDTNVPVKAATVPNMCPKEELDIQSKCVEYIYFG